MEHQQWGKAEAKPRAGRRLAAEEPVSAAGRPPGRAGARTTLGVEGRRPSRCILLRISLRARRTASAFSRARLSQGFS